jgi:hypothetical protein
MPHISDNRRIAFRNPLLLAMLVATLGTAVVAAPAAAKIVDHGATAACYYKTVADDAYPAYYWGGILKRINVTPPTMYSINSSNQSVAWRFTIERMRQDLYPLPPEWKTTYTSGLQLSIASPTSAADFTAMGVKVDLPKLSDTSEYTWNNVYYRVRLTRVWYRPSGSIAKVVKDVMSRTQVYEDGEFGYTQGNLCAGGRSIFQPH